MVAGCLGRQPVPLCDHHAAALPESLLSELCEKAEDYMIVKQASLAWLKLNDRQTPSSEEMQALRGRL